MIQTPASLMPARTSSCSGTARSSGCSCSTRLLRSTPSPRPGCEEPDGRLVSGGKTVRGPLVISNFAVRARLAGAAQARCHYELGARLERRAWRCSLAASTTTAGSPTAVTSRSGRPRRPRRGAIQPSRYRPEPSERCSTRAREEPARGRQADAAWSSNCRSRTRP
jgi:hypothetical protein